MTQKSLENHFVVAQLAKEKAAKSRVPEAEWAEVLQRGLEGLRGQDVDLTGLEKIARACSSPKQFALMVRLISHHCRTHGQGRKVFDLITKHITMTVFSLSEWIASLEVFADWLDQHHQQLDFLNMLNYLQCCTQLPDAKAPGAKLQDALMQAIDKYGVSWAAAKK